MTVDLVWESHRVFYTDGRLRRLMVSWEQEISRSRGTYDSPLLSNLLPIVRDLFRDCQNQAEGWIIAGFLAPLLTPSCPGNIIFGSGHDIIHMGLLHDNCPPETLRIACRHRYLQFADTAIHNENCREEDAVYAVLRRQEGTLTR